MSTTPWIPRVVFLVACLFVALAMRPLAILAPAGRALVPNLVAAALAALIGLLAERVAREIEPRAAAGSMLGAVTGGILAAFLTRALPLRATPTAGPLEPYVYLVFLFLGAAVGLRAAAAPRTTEEPAPQDRTPPASAGPKIIDSSAAIDGRIADVARVGCLDGTWVVPDFVLREIQAIADGEDASRRARGRRGLDTLEAMREHAPDRLTVLEAGDDPRPVDDRLIELAARLDGALVTTDFNLAKVAAVRGVRVVNVHAIAAAFRTRLQPGDTLRLGLLKEGREPGQGIGYLDDGTMVIVEQGRDSIGRAVEVVVTGLTQTASGRLVFARIAAAGSDGAQIG